MSGDRGGAGGADGADGADGAAALWRSVARAWGDDYAVRYAERFDALAASGQDIHGEAAFVDRLVASPARVLDAGCGAGRIGQRLHDLGHRVVGVDADETMVAVAVSRCPAVEWLVADLAALALPGRFDLVVAAGNVVPFIEATALPEAMSRLAAHLAPGGLVVTGFGLDAAHLPAGARRVPLRAYDDAATDAGLRLRSRHGGWDGEEYADGGYVVSVHEAAAPRG